MGSDLGGALKGFKTAMKDDEGNQNELSENADAEGDETINTTAEKVEEK